MLELLVLVTDYTSLVVLIINTLKAFPFISSNIELVYMDNCSPQMTSPIVGLLILIKSSHVFYLLSNPSIWELICIYECINF